MWFTLGHTVAKIIEDSTDKTKVYLSSFNTNQMLKCPSAALMNPF